MFQGVTLGGLAKVVSAGQQQSRAARPPYHPPREIRLERQRHGEQPARREERRPAHIECEPHLAGARLDHDSLRHPDGLQGLSSSSCATQPTVT